MAKLKSMRTNTLLNSKKRGDKLAGVLKKFGEAEAIRGKEEKRQNVLNKCSKSVITIRLMSEKELDENKITKEAMIFAPKNWKSIKEASENPKAPFTEEMQKHYKNLLTLGKVSNKTKAPNEISF